MIDIYDIYYFIRHFHLHRLDAIGDQWSFVLLENLRVFGKDFR